MFVLRNASRLPSNIALRFRMEHLIEEGEALRFHAFDIVSR